MEFLTTLILEGITSYLTGKVLDYTGKKIKDSIIGTDKEQAIERCLNAL